MRPDLMPRALEDHATRQRGLTFPHCPVSQTFRSNARQRNNQSVAARVRMIGHFHQHPFPPLQDQALLHHSPTVQSPLKQRQIMLAGQPAVLRLLPAPFSFRIQRRHDDARSRAIQAVQQTGAPRKPCQQIPQADPGLSRQSRAVHSSGLEQRGQPARLRFLRGQHRRHGAGQECSVAALLPCGQRQHVAGPGSVGGRARPAVDLGPTQLAGSAPAAQSHSRQQPRQSRVQSFARITFSNHNAHRFIRHALLPTVTLPLQRAPRLSAQRTNCHAA